MLVRNSSPVLDLPKVQPCWRYTYGSVFGWSTYAYGLPRVLGKRHLTLFSNKKLVSLQQNIWCSNLSNFFWNDLFLMSLSQKYVSVCDVFLLWCANMRVICEKLNILLRGFVAKKYKCHTSAYIWYLSTWPSVSSYYASKNLKTDGVTSLFIYCTMRLFVGC